MIERGWHRLAEAADGFIDDAMLEMYVMDGELHHGQQPHEHSASHDNDDDVGTNPDQLILSARTASLASFSTAPSLDLDLAHQHTLRHRGAGLVRTFIIVVKSFVGTGILCMPRAFSNGGILFAPLVMGLMGIYSLVCMVLLVKCRQKIQGPCGFSDLGKLAYGPRLGWLIKVSIVLSQCGFCAGYCIFISHNLMQVLAAVGLHPPWLSEAWLVLFQLVIHIPLALIRQMKTFAAPALVAEFCIFGGIFCITAYAVYVIRSPEYQANPPPLQLFNQEHFAIFIGMVISAFEGIAVVLPIHDSMSRPSKFNALLSGNILLMMVTYAAFACIGYTAFGSNVHDVIILDLPRHSLLSSGIQLAYCVAIIFTFPLQLFPVLQILEKGMARNTAMINMFRSSVVVLIALLAVASTEHLEHLQAVIGALCCAPLAFIFPSLIHYKVAAVHWYEKALDVIYGTLGCVIMVYVLYISVWSWAFEPRHHHVPTTLP